MNIKLDYDGKTYEAKPMTWDDVEKVEELLSGTLLSFSDALANAKSKTNIRALGRELQKTKANQRRLVEDMLRKYLKLDSKALIDLGYIGAVVLFSKMYKANTEVEPFLGMQSRQPSSSGSLQTIQTSSPSPS